MVLDRNIQTFVREVAEAFQISESHPVTVVLMLGMVLVGAFVCLFVLPIYRTFGSGGREDTVWGKRSVLTAHLLMICVAFSPIAITNTAANKFGTGALCEICGRPGAIFWSSTSKGSPFAECFCERHADHADKSGWNGDLRGKDASSDLGLATGVNVFLLLALWGLGAAGVSMFAASAQEKACCLAISLLPLMLLFDWHLYGQWIGSIIGQAK